MASKKPLQVSFDANGDMHESHRTVSSYSVVKLEDAVDFNDTMEYISMADCDRRNSRVYLKSVITGRTYSMFLSNFDLVIKAKRFIDNQVSGTWHYLRGSGSQSIKLLLEDEK